MAAIGIFDGVHRGHQVILRAAVRRARALRAEPAAVTFHPHPLAVLKPAIVPPLLLSLDQRLRLFGRAGIRRVFVVPFTRRFSRWTPEQFASRVLAGRARVREVVVGHDFGFGAGRSGDAGTLAGLGRRCGFKVRVIGPVKVGGRRISSRAIRRLIGQGRMNAARRMLGRPASAVGRVVRGAGRGAKLGFPTANVRVEAGVLPPLGVYAVRAGVGGRRRPGMANLGHRPTFQKAKIGTGYRVPGTRYQVPVLEVHLFGPRRSLYRKRLEVEFIRRLRPERRFPSPQALARQLARDAARARRVLALHSSGRVV